MSEEQDPDQADILQDPENVQAFAALDEIKARAEVLKLRADEVKAELAQALIDLAKMEKLNETLQAQVNQNKAMDSMADSLDAIKTVVEDGKG